MTQRKIMFRGISEETKEMVYGDLVHGINGEPIITYHEITPPTMQDPAGDTIKMYVRVLPETIGQYTGILDKAEVEVFEGDILEYLDDDANYEGGINTFYNRGAVEWDEENACFYVSNRNNVVYVWDDCEIIGNIHQNKELIKQQ